MATAGGTLSLHGSKAGGGSWADVVVKGVFGTQLLYSGSAEWQPPVDVYELPARFVILVEIPGVAKDSIDVTFERNVLTISGWREDPSPPGRVCLHQMEISHGQFQRSCTVRSEYVIDR